MMSVLTFTVSTGFLSNAYQKAYAAADLPTTDLLSPKIREWINNQMREDLFTPSSSSGPIQQIQSIKLTLSGFPHQTGESVTNIDLRPSPCRVQIDITCTGLSNIVIPGIGEVSVSIWFAPIGSVFGLLLLFAIMNSKYNPLFGDNSVIPFTRTIYIPGVGSGQATVQLS